jgi:hypothetical protein
MHGPKKEQLRKRGDLHPSTIHEVYSIVMENPLNLWPKIERQSLENGVAIPIFVNNSSEQ